MDQVLHQDGHKSVPPAWLHAALDVPPLDVRPVLAAGQDPFQVLMAQAAQVADGQAMVVDAPFNPAPLRRVLAGQGFSSYGRRLSATHWRIFFCRDGGRDWDRQAEVEVGPEGAFSWREDDGLHMDVRKLVPPQPMLAILRMLAGMQDDRVLVVHHDRIPHHLIPELAEIGWSITRTVQDFANVRLWLERDG